VSVERKTNWLNLFYLVKRNSFFFSFEKFLASIILTKSERVLLLNRNSILAMLLMDKRLTIKPRDLEHPQGIVKKVSSRNESLFWGQELIFYI